MENKHTKSLINIYLLLFTFFGCTYSMQSQVTIAKNEFLGTGGTTIVNGGGYTTATPNLTPNDTWEYEAIVNNGEIQIVDEFTGSGYGIIPASAPNSLMIRDWYGTNEVVQFNSISISGYTDVQFSIAYASENVGIFDSFSLEYSYDNGATWETPVLLLALGTNQGFGSVYTLPINDGGGSGDDNVSSFSFRVYNSGNDGNDRFYIDDVIITGTPPLNPVASDDNLSITKNSNGGIDNRIDVSLNDYIGFGDGTDGDDFSITSSPLTTVNGGSVTEISDGIFEYIPATDFTGNDSFIYTICDAGGDCDTATVFVNVNYGVCIPESNSNGTHFITNVTLAGETTLNNNSNDDGGYRDFSSTVAATDLFLGKDYLISIDVAAAQASENNSGWAVYIDLNQNGAFDSPEEVLYNINATENIPFSPQLISIPNNAVLGKTIIRVGTMQYYSANNPCNNANRGEFEDYVVDIKIDSNSLADINLSSNNISIVNGSTTTSLNNNTDFGEYDIYNALPMQRIFIITNNGGTDLNLNGTPYVDFTSPTPDFTITQPAKQTLTSGESTTFIINFNPTSIGIKQATITISNNDLDENPFTFLIEGEGVETFPDTDGDGITDNVDLDDDNDGLLDGDENNMCLTYPFSSTTEVIFLNETFEAGLSRRPIDAYTSNAWTTYCYEDGTGSCPSSYEPNSVNDGDYTIHHTVTNNNNTIDDIDTDISQWADQFWYEGEDHTPGDTNGRMAIFNATEDPGVFYSAVINGVTANSIIDYGFWAINLDRSDAPCVNGSGLDENGNPCDGTIRTRPEVLIEIFDPNGNLITSSTSGSIEPTNAANINGDWVQVHASFVSPYTQFTVQLSNANPGGKGNDLAIDDIFVKQILCDLDGDGIADEYDLDNDNDGIPNVIELGLSDNDFDATVFNDPTNVWVDANSNGVHDSYESIIPIDTDGDGVPDYIDLDSDNDGIFDNVEYDTFGDIDITGNGVGDGSDLYNANPLSEQDGDGILAIMDLNDDGVGTDHGSTGYPAPLDSDGDGVPNYIDIDSNDATNNPLNGSDINTTIYAYLDTNNDGVIDGSIDIDQDGILDSFDTDTSANGSPRDLDNKYTLFFDGRNDYVSENIPVINGWANGTLMAWIKIEAGASGQRRIVGQDNFYITVNSDNTVSAIVGGTSLNSISILPENIWVHVAASYNNGDGNFTLYVNGEEEDVLSASGNIATGTTDLTIGRKPGISGEENVLTSEYFEGEIDEVRLFDAALTEDEIQKMVYQELDEINNFKQGSIIPINIATTFNTSLRRYFKMDGYKDDIVDNKITPTIDQGTGAKIYNIKNIYFQTAPLPYQTKADGSWSNKATWLHGDVWDIDDEVNNKDWSIVEVKHNITTSNRHGTLGLLINPNVKLEINSDVELLNTWYLNLEGFIDLQGESQLVQTQNSQLIAGANGVLQRDQQGTINLYTYNYWSSPVHTINPNAEVDGDESYTVASVLKDGEDAQNPAAINFISGYNGNNSTNPIQISNYWIWKFNNKLSDNYSDWQHILSTGNLLIGEGYTMKGPGSGAISTDKNYVFEGSPNNGEIILPTSAGNDYLVGNPYPSAIDANQFINDNPHLDGTLYFWEHYGGNSHNLKEYEGGYGLYTLSGGVAAIGHSSVASSGTALKTPRRYIPVSQGFFVTATTSGNTKFENDQRVFVTETNNTNSWFFKESSNYKTTKNQNNIEEDIRPKFRIGYNSPNGYDRQLLLTIDKNTTMSYDWGYEAPLIENNLEDMFWNIGNSKYIIQGINGITETTVLPIGVKTVNGGSITIHIDALENVSDDISVYLKDHNTNTLHDLRTSPYTTNVDSGILNERFQIVFVSNLLSSNETDLKDSLNLFYNISKASIVISNEKNIEIKKLQGVNILGQNVLEKNLNSRESQIIMPINLATGVYVFTIQTSEIKITKKIVVTN